MRGKLRVSLLVLAVMLLFSGTSRADLVVNGDFQDSNNHWTGWTQNIYGFQWGDPHQDNYSAAFSYFPGTLSQTISTTPDTSYEFSFWLMHDSTGGRKISPLTIWRPKTSRCSGMEV
jgi:hypothetical protein